MVILFKVWCPDYHEEADAVTIEADFYQEAVEEFCLLQHTQGCPGYFNGEAGEILVRMVQGPPSYDHEVYRYTVEAWIRPVFHATPVGPKKPFCGSRDDQQ